jgi:hypothetical protein
MIKITTYLDPSIPILPFEVINLKEFKKYGQLKTLSPL